MCACIVVPGSSAVIIFSKCVQQASHDAHGTVLDGIEDRLTSHEVKSAASLVSRGVCSASKSYTFCLSHKNFYLARAVIAEAVIASRMLFASL